MTWPVVLNGRSIGAVAAHVTASLAISAVSVTSAQAMTVPTKSAQDSRFQTIPYTPDVIRIQTKVGRLLEIEFGKDETSVEFNMGDRDAWKIKVVGNVMYIKPKALMGDTNLRVITNKHKYWFDLVMSEHKQALAYHVDFQYPYVPPPRIVPGAPVVPVLSPAEIAANEKKFIDLHLSEAMTSVLAKAGTPMANSHALNGDYGLIGPDELTPTAVYDNGDMTFIQFAPNRPMPTVFGKETDGSEARVPFHVENDILVIHRIGKQFVLRRGATTACLINGSFNPTGSNKTQTTSDSVKRVIKGEL